MFDTFIMTASTLGEFTVRHWPAFSALTVLAGALWVFWRRENLNVVRNFWAVLEEDGGKLWFRLYSERDAYLWLLFPNDPIMRWQLRRAARSGAALTREHSDIDYIPWSRSTSRLRSLLRSHVSSIPLQWFEHVCNVVGFISRPVAILIAERYPDGADMCFRNVLMHPATLDRLVVMGDWAPGELSSIEVDSANHRDLLARLIRLAPIVLDKTPATALARERIGMSTIRVPASELERVIGV